jgi:pimeloyl-ACP methyl ester carboxylesterase
MPDAAPCYRPHALARPRTLTLRGLRYHLWEWGDDGGAAAALPPLVMVHGWADVGASFQFVVDELARLEGGPRHVLAPDWRGFGQSANSGSDAYWFADYLGDLDTLIDAISPGAPVDLLGHSMGGNVVMSYAGVRPARIRRLVNLEGFGMPRTQPEQAPARLAQWLDSLKQPQRFKGFDSLAEVAARLQANNPRLSADKAHWLAPHWAALDDSDGRWHVRCDPAHKRVNAMLYRVDEILATWAAIRAPLLWVEGDLTDIGAWWGQRYTKAEFHERLSVVPQVRRETLTGCGHMLHHDRPQAVAALLAEFLTP